MDGKTYVMSLICTYMLNIIYKFQVKYERTRLLQHPVTRELVSYKWRAYAMPAFMISFTIYVVFLACLTAFALVIPLPTELECRSGSEDCSTG